MSNRSRSSKKAPRPGVLMRGALTAAYAARGQRNGKLWIQYSAKAKKDVAFATELAYVHFLYVESSFEATHVEYTPDEKVTRAVGACFVEYVDAAIKLANGDVVWRHVCADNESDASKSLGAQLAVLLEHVRMPDGAPTPRLEFLTHQQLLASEMRIRNWHRVAAWLAAARDWELHEYQTEVAALIRRAGRVEFQDVLALGKGGERGCLYGAALLQQLQRGAYQTNLFDAPFTLRSVFSQRLAPARQGMSS